MQKIISIVGPTAAGKSVAAIELASALGAEIISADSIQVYRYLDIGSGKPTTTQRQQVKHHLVDILNPDQHYSSAIFANKAAKIIDNLKSKNKPAIVCGGSMLYIKSLLFGLAAIPPIKNSIFKEVEQIYQEKGLDYCLQLLQKLNKNSQFHFKDPQRVKRALAVIKQTGQPIEAFQQQHQFQHPLYNNLFIGLNHPRQELYTRINDRVDKMIEQGLEEECKKIIALGYHQNLAPLQSIGYKQAIEYLLTNSNRLMMIEKIKQKTRNYAKRQLTWYKKESNIHWFTNINKNMLNLAQNFYKTAN